MLVKDVTIMGIRDAYFSNLLQNLTDGEDHTHTDANEKKSRVSQFQTHRSYI